MEDTLFGFFLFLTYLIFIASVVSNSTEKDSAWEMDDRGDIVIAQSDGVTTTVTPIKQQLKTVLWDETHEPTVEELLDGIEVEKITVRKARKIASKLGIKQKVNGKDQPKAWLVAQIAKRLNTEPQTTAAVIKEICQVAA